MTLMEIAIVAVITGVIGAMGVPSLMGMLQGDQVKQGLDQIQLALQDAQRQAIRNSKQCAIVINPEPQLQPNGEKHNIYVKDTDSNGCLGSVERELPKDVVITNTGTTPPTFTFSFKGNMAGIGTTIVVKPAKGRGDKRCLVITQGLGIMRTGIYDPTQSDNPPNKDYCQKLIQN